MSRFGVLSTRKIGWRKSDPRDPVRLAGQSRNRKKITKAKSSALEGFFLFFQLSVTIITSQSTIPPLAISSTGLPSQAIDHHRKTSQLRTSFSHRRAVQRKWGKNAVTQLCQVGAPLRCSQQRRFAVIDSSTTRTSAFSNSSYSNRVLPSN